MARTGDSGSACAAWNRETTASSDCFDLSANSCENSGNPSDRLIVEVGRAIGFAACPASPFLLYHTPKAPTKQHRKEMFRVAQRAVGASKCTYARQHCRSRLRSRSSTG